MLQWKWLGMFQGNSLLYRDYIYFTYSKICRRFIYLNSFFTQNWKLFRTLFQLPVLANMHANGKCDKLRSTVRMPARPRTVLNLKRKLMLLPRSELPLELELELSASDSWKAVQLDSRTYVRFAVKLPSCLPYSAVCGRVCVCAHPFSGTVRFATPI